MDEADDVLEPEVLVDFVNEDGDVGLRLELASSFVVEVEEVGTIVLLFAEEAEACEEEEEEELLVEVDTIEILLDLMPSCNSRCLEPGVLHVVADVEDDTELRSWYTFKLLIDQYLCSY